MAETNNAIKSVSIRHEAIMQFLLANPQVRLQDVAKHFGITQGWLSQVIHSDAFQAMLRERQDVAFHTTVLPLREKMTLIAHQALDKLEVAIESESDTKVLSGIAEGVLDRLGYGTKAAPQMVNNIQVNQQVNVLRSELEEARQLIGSKRSFTSLEDAMNGVRAALPLPAEDRAGVGETLDATPVVRESSAVEPGG